MIKLQCAFVARYEAPPARYQTRYGRGRVLGGLVESERRLPRQNAVLKPSQVSVDRLNCLDFVVGRVNRRPKQWSAGHFDA